jgi:pimeloyl-ACP methyl ester carboxylesterase
VYVSGKGHFSDVSDERGTLLLVTEKQQSRRRPHRCRRPANRKRGEAENLCGVSPFHVEPFEIEVPERTLSALRERIRNTRWPPPSPEPGWEQGAELSYVRGLLKYWADGFDWRLQERRLNEFAHFRGEIDGVRIHFVHERRGGIPLILTHGWPSTFVEHLQLAPLLPEFDLVIPSLPGYGFSERPPRTTMRDTARLWHRLMQGLGYKRYGAQGGDFGASVTTYMALDEPAPLLGIHLHMIDDTPYSGGRPLSATERDYREAVAAWDAVERGYSSIQSTKPQTVAYGLNDSPAGLAAWLVEKWRSWSHSLDAIDRDLLLTNMTIFWVTETIGTSMRDYYDKRRYGPTIGPEDFVTVPTAVAVFANELVSEGTPPREWAERLYDVRRWTPMPRGGHFAPAEAPDLLARDISEFFAGRLGDR